MENGKIVTLDQDIEETWKKHNWQVITILSDRAKEDNFPVWIVKARWIEDKRKIKKRKTPLQKLMEEIDRMENYAKNMKKEDLTEFAKGYWNGQENLIKEIKKLIKEHLS